ncbi:formyltetrahydrofolate deformylase [Changchengzhania lutea]|uniref:formyltetrahydrofolate deformylase n=1 Tax=Changchengzhania lutea TaxID=2049305 RepID=UPI00115E7746|nr:formyltetrahydrofolate deformylase [Changchengzhania lutea]
MNTITILIHCKDQSNIIASVTNFISNNNGNIVYIDQHVDREQNIFFMRLESEFPDTFAIEQFKITFKETLANTFNMKWRMYSSEKKPKMAVFVSKYDHCLYDLLGRYNSGELNLEIPFIISNHDDLKPIAEAFNIPFYHIPVTKDTKALAEKKQLDLLEKFDIDFIVLARYMQIISERLIDKYPNKIINIHHSFLPAFVGAKPYHSAFKRGVKIIGATSHYVTEELDAGPIIEQDVTRVTHAHSIHDLIAKGRDLEKIVLANAVKLHANRKVMVYNNKTVIFS